MITRSQIRQFLAVVDGGSFTRAAELINVTQPTLSAGIAGLERHLGTKLFVREKRRIQLTEAGTKLLVHARNIQREFRLAEDRSVTAIRPTEPLKLGVLDSIATHITGSLIFSYNVQRSEDTAQCAPLSVVEGREKEIVAAFANNSIDAALTIIGTQLYNHDHRVLMEEPYLLMVAANHRLAKQRIVSPEEVRNETMMARRSCEILSQTSDFFTSHGARPPFSLKSSNDDRVMAMVRAGLGITVAPKSLQIDGVAGLQLEGFMHSRRTGLVFGRKTGHQYAACQALAEIIDHMRDDIMRVS